MPNGISCAYFTAKNFITGKKEGNYFRDGIAGAQAVRTVDSVADGIRAAGVAAETCNSAASASTGFIGKAAAFAKRIVYPLIILSGVYDTIRSKDKVRTGVSQGLGITSMYIAEQGTEKLLKGFKNLTDRSAAVQNNRLLRFGLYAARGACFAAASLFGYKIGSEGGKNIVDELRSNRSERKEAKQQAAAPVLDDSAATVQNTTDETENKDLTLSA